MTNKSTINAIISEGKHLKMTMADLSFKEVLYNSSSEKFVVNMTNIFEKYYELLLESVYTVELTEEEYMKYKFNPKLLAQDIYGNKELAFLILRVNYMSFTFACGFPTRIFKGNVYLSKNTKKWIIFWYCWGFRGVNYGFERL